MKDYDGWAMVRRWNGEETRFPRTFRPCRSDVWDVFLSGYIGSMDRGADIRRQLRREGYKAVRVKLVEAG